MDFAQPQALRDAVGDDFVGACQHIDIEFLFIGCIGTYSDHRGSGLQPCRSDQWFAAGSDCDDHVCAFHRCLHGTAHGKIARRNAAAF